MPSETCSRYAAAASQQRKLANEAVKAACPKKGEPQDPCEPMSDAEVASYVQPYGYAALGPLQWERMSSQTAWPKLTLTMYGHAEIDDHTCYRFRCELDTQVGGAGPRCAPSLSLKWGVQRRLAHLREGLHDIVQSCLGDGYHKVFGEARFARHGGPPGTSARLEAWLAKLVLHVNDGTAAPEIVAQVLHFFEVPQAPAGSTVRALLDFSDVPRPLAKASAPFSADRDSPHKTSLAAFRESELLASRKVSFAIAEGDPSPSEGPCAIGDLNDDGIPSLQCEDEGESVFAA